jgi:secondary thiamine-phosphate synthase enzyme
MARGFHALILGLFARSSALELRAPPSVGWAQTTIEVTAPRRGCHLITTDVLTALNPALASIQYGLCNLFVQHTSCSLSINENTDPTVRDDLERALNRVIPTEWNHDGTFRHTLEGEDDMPGHVKSSLVGVSLNIPVSRGALALGEWQGIYLCEHRDASATAHRRRIVLTLQGELAEMSTSAVDPRISFPVYV